MASPGSAVVTTRFQRTGPLARRCCSSWLRKSTLACLRVSASISTTGACGCQRQRTARFWPCALVNQKLLTLLKVVSAQLLVHGAVLAHCWKACALGYLASTAAIFCGSGLPVAG